MNKRVITVVLTVLIVAVVLSALTVLGLGAYYYSNIGRKNADTIPYRTIGGPHTSDECKYIPARTINYM